MTGASRLRSFRELALSVLVALVASACSGDALVNPTAMQASSGNAFATGSTGDKPKFDPFRDASSAATPGREVIANPTVAEIMQPASNLPEIAIGRVDAPVTIIKYKSLTCPFCRKFQAEVFPVLKRDYIDTGKVQFILREFPIGMQSGAATIAMRCATPDKHFALYDKFMAQQAAWVSQDVRRDPIFKIASQVGMTRPEFDACFENRSMIAALNQIKERGRTLGVIGTPNFFVQGKLVKSTLDMVKLREMIDPILAGRVAERPTSEVR